MSKKIRKGLIGSAFAGFLTGLGISSYDTNKDQVEALSPVQVESVTSGQVIRTSDLKQETPSQTLKEIQDSQNSSQGERISSLSTNSALPLLERKEDLEIIHKKLVGKKNLSSREYQFLLLVISHLSELSPNGSQDHLLTQKLKDIRWLGNKLKRQQAFENLHREIESIITKYSHLEPNDFLDNVRNKDKALSIEQGLLTLDFTRINPNLARLIEDYSRNYDLNPRLVSVICTMENNFGLQKVSAKNAKGMCQTMVSLVRHYYPNYASLNESDQLFAHFVTTFKYLEDLKKKFNLSIGYYDDPFKNKEDFLKATILYHDGASNVIERNGRILQGTNGQKYVLKALQSFKILVMILDSSQG